MYLTVRATERGAKAAALTLGAAAAPRLTRGHAPGPNRGASGPAPRRYATAVRIGPPPRYPTGRWRTLAADARGGAQHLRLTCAHDCSGWARRRFCISVARWTKTVSSARTPGSLRRRFGTAGPAAGPLVVEDSIVTPPPTAPRPGEEPGGAQMLVVDLWGTLMLLNEARYRTFERTFGVSRDQVNLTTVMLALVAAEAIHTQAQKVKPSRRPTRGRCRDRSGGAAGIDIQRRRSGVSGHAAGGIADRAGGPRRVGATGGGEIGPRHEGILAPHAHDVPRSLRPPRGPAPPGLTSHGAERQRSCSGTSRSVCTSSSTCSIE